MRPLMAVLAPLPTLELGPMFLHPVIARREYKVLRRPQSRQINKVTQQDEETTYSRDVHVIKDVAADIVSVHAAVLSFALLCTD